MVRRCLTIYNNCCYRPIDDDNIDGQEMSDDDYQDDKSQDSYGTPRQHHQPEMTEERRRKLREIEVFYLYIHVLGKQKDYVVVICFGFLLFSLLAIGLVQEVE